MNKITKQDAIESANIPDFNDSILEFFDKGDSSIAYHPLRHLVWNVLPNKTLGINTDYFISYDGDGIDLSETDYGKPISREEAVKIAEEINELKDIEEKLLSVSEEALFNWMPSIDHPRLRFVEVEDRPIAYFPHNTNLLWRVNFDKTLKQYKGYPHFGDIIYNGCHISKQEALIYAEYWDARKKGKDVILRFDGGKTLLIYSKNNHK